MFYVEHNFQHFKRKFDIKLEHYSTKKIPCGLFPHGISCVLNDLGNAAQILCVGYISKFSAYCQQRRSNTGAVLSADD